MVKANTVPVNINSKGFCFKPSFDSWLTIQILLCIYYNYPYLVAYIPVVEF